MNSTIVIALIAVIAVGGAAGGAFVLMNNDDGNNAPATTPTDNTPTYTITYDLDGGTGTTPTQKALKEGESFDLASCDATKRGHDFNGWSDGEKNYKAGSSYTIAAKDVVLKAIWNVASYSVTAPQSSAGYEVTAANETVVFNNSYTFTVAVPEKYSGPVTVTAGGDHGTITQTTEGNTTTVTIPEIASDISDITLGGVTELGIGTHFDYVLSGTWSTTSTNGTLEGSCSYKYVAQNADDIIFAYTSVFKMMQGETVISTKDTTEDPTFYLGDLTAADYCLDMSSLTPAGTAIVVTTDGQKTLNKYTYVVDSLTTTFYVDSSNNILYKFTTVGTKGEVSMNYSYELGVYEILRESPYTPSEKLSQYYVMNVTGTKDTRAAKGDVRVDYWAEAPTQHINKTTYNVKYADDSSALLVGEQLDLEENDDSKGIDIPTGAVRGDDVVEMTIDGEKTLQVWTHTEEDLTTTVYIGENNGQQIPYKVIQSSPSKSLTLTWLLSEYNVLE